MTFRTIEIPDGKSVVPAEQPSPMLQWVPIAQLVIDERYQRPLLRGNWVVIHKIAEGFDWSCFSQVLVAPIEGGRFAVIDGQHRVHAAALCGIESVPAMVVLVPSTSQAKAFVRANQNRTAISPFHILRAALAAGEAWAERCQWAVEQGGCRLMLSNGNTATKKAGEIYAVGFIRSCIERGWSDAVVRGLSAIRAYDEKGRVPLYSDYILKPLIAAVAQDPQFTAEVIEAAFRAHDPFTVMAAVERMESGQAIGPRRATAFATIFRQQLKRRAA